MPDPALTQWYKENKKAKKAGIAKQDRPKKPAKNPQYPTKQELSLELLKTFKALYPSIKVRVIVADALYGNKKFVQKASSIFGGVQVISQLLRSQNVHFWNKWVSVEEYFQGHPGILKHRQSRGGETITAIVSSARLFVKAHKRKIFVIAIKYSEDQEYRYLLATDVSWQTNDIIQAYTYRWLIEVIEEDWKLYEGWDQLAKQPGEEGSRRSLILSLLLLHPEQKARIENKQPAVTVGSLLEKIKVESLLEFIRHLLAAVDPHAELERLSQVIDDVFQLSDSKKHMNNKELGRLEPTPSLKHKAQMA